MRDTDVSLLARRLFDAFESGEKVPPLTGQVVTLDAATAYQVRRQPVGPRQRTVVSGKISGRRVGLASKATRPGLRWTGILVFDNGSPARSKERTAAKVELFSIHPAGTGPAPERGWQRGGEHSAVKEDLKTARGFAMGELTLRPFAGEQLMVVRVEGAAGTVAPSHSHPHEQISMVESGRVRFELNGETLEVGAGEILHIPGDTEHEAELLEDSVFFDIFHPVREELLEKLEENS